MEEENKEPDILRKVMTDYQMVKRPDPYADIELDSAEIDHCILIARENKKRLINNEDAVIELDADEIDKALRKARQIKSGLLHNINYTKKLGEAVSFPKYSTNQFAKEVLNKIRLSIPKFIIDNENSYVFYALVKYFIGDKSFLELNERYDFNKGIAIQGPIGCGKTSLMRGFNVNPTNSFRFVSCRTIADEYTDKEYGGKPIINKYSSLFKVQPDQYWGQRQIGLFADDLGTEDVVKHMGNEKNVMEYIIQNRYDDFHLRGKTHITTNLSKTQIEEFYGPRVRSRVEEMFNWLVFDINVCDRRR